MFVIVDKPVMTYEHLKLTPAIQTRTSWMATERLATITRDGRPRTRWPIGRKIDKVETAGLNPLTVDQSVQRGET